MGATEHVSISSELRGILNLGYVDEAQKEGRQMPVNGFAVVDFETTGVIPERGDRVIEIGVVHVDLSGRIEGEFETVVNPDRDLGPSAIHGLYGRHVKDAPRFEDIAGGFVDLLRDRMFVAHNASFEARFLRTELERVGGGSPIENAAAFDTMRLAGELLPGSGRALADCCLAFDIPLTNAHEALADARATAHLLSAYMRQAPAHPAWHQHYRVADSWIWPEVVRGRSDWVGRVRQRDAALTFIDEVARSMPAHADLEPHEVAYLALLDKVLVDGFVSLDEAAEVIDLARAHGIEKQRMQELNERYVKDLGATAWADHVLTEEESAQLMFAARTLAVPERILQAALSRPSETLDRPQAEAHTESQVDGGFPPVAAGDLIAFTGSMPRPRDEYEELAEAMGLKPWPSVTKKVALLVAADPDSLSGKAKKARDYSIPVVSVEQFVHAARVASRK